MIVLNACMMMFEYYSTVKKFDIKFIHSSQLITSSSNTFKSNYCTKLLLTYTNQNPFTHLSYKYLSFLSLSDNKIRKISESTFWPLKNLENLLIDFYYLYYNFSQLVVKFKYPSLYLNDNKIDKLSKKAWLYMENITMISLSNNVGRAKYDGSCSSPAKARLE